MREIAALSDSQIRDQFVLGKGPVENSRQQNYGATNSDGNEDKISNHSHYEKPSVTTSEVPRGVSECKS